MRIIAGEHKGRRLATPRGLGIRPTADRLRETIFNIIAPQVPHADVLDLFAGSGAMAIEAISRGAARAVCIDNNASALHLIQRNVATCGYQERIAVRRWNIISNLKCLNSFQVAFNLVFMDPPYRQNMVAPALHNLLYCDCLSPEALIVIEHDRAEPLDLGRFADLKLCDQRVYGSTLLTRVTLRKIRFIP